MTLALYGKSRRRQLILLIAAVVSVALATLGGATLRSAGQAQVIDGPDLVATKTNNVGGSVVPDESFTWTFSLSNVGNEDALVPQNNELFIDYLPTGVSYEIVGVVWGRRDAVVLRDRGDIQTAARYRHVTNRVV